MTDPSLMLLSALLSLSPCVCVCVSLCLFVRLSFSFSISHSRPLSLSLSVFLCASLPDLSPYLSISVFLCTSLSFSLSVLGCRARANGLDSCGCVRVCVAGVCV